MKTRLVRIESEGVVELDMGTCELCMTTIDIEKFNFIFSYVDPVNGGIKYIEIPNYEYGVWDYDIIDTIDNIPHFAEYFNSLGIDHEELDFYKLYRIVSNYDDIQYYIHINNLNNQNKKELKK